jgi:prepilin-type N-terminal cleavage/methylation domain-containing protein
MLSKGFTLVELALVLVIIGLIAGGVMIGQDLISAAHVRAQISQFEKFNTAVNTFRSKYNGIPGDLRSDQAQGFGFVARAGTRSHGDGNGVLEKCDLTIGAYPVGCEFLLFWSDLSLSGLIDANLPGAVDGDPNANSYEQTLTYFPRSKVSEGTTVLAAVHNDSSFWYVLMGFDHIDPFNMAPRMYPMSGPQAYGFDVKVDDGYALTGNTRATMWNQLDPVTGDQTFVVVPAFQGPEFCIDNGDYNKINAGPFLCYLAVKMQF